jgi:hypothetical protein
MKSVAATLFAVLLCGCATAPPVVLPDFIGEAENACLPESIILAESLHKQNIPARILLIRTPTFSHAVVAFIYPVESPSLQVWDVYTRAIKIDADFDNPGSIAVEWLRANIIEGPVISASFL